ncbi:hypothetical protein Franean1_0493 [Parafrankia sp. EAN1pec]|nr:hypothetical protein Franean1_0493 [Frankia sp. EAN1pec]
MHRPRSQDQADFWHATGPGHHPSNIKNLKSAVLAGGGARQCRPGVGQPGRVHPVIDQEKCGSRSIRRPGNFPGYVLASLAPASQRTFRRSLVQISSAIKLETRTGVRVPIRFPSGLLMFTVRFLVHRFLLV